MLGSNLILRLSDDFLLNFKFRQHFPQKKCFWRSVNMSHRILKISILSNCWYHRDEDRVPPSSNSVQSLWSRRHSQENPSPSRTPWRNWERVLDSVSGKFVGISKHPRWRPHRLHFHLFFPELRTIFGSRWKRNQMMTLY